jgi:hypothetical protein
VSHAVGCTVALEGALASYAAGSTVNASLDGALAGTATHAAAWTATASLYSVVPAGLLADPFLPAVLPAHAAGSTSLSSSFTSLDGALTATVSHAVGSTVAASLHGALAATATHAAAWTATSFLYSVVPCWSAGGSYHLPASSDR